MKVIVIIPAYNEQDCIESVVKELQTTVPEYDYIVINDCSTDNTASILKQKKINHISLPVNLGIGGAVQTGYKYAVEGDYDIAVQYDGDGQHDPKYLKEIVTPVANGEADMCIGSRFIEKKGFQTSFMRRFGINFLKNLIFICSGTRVTDVTSGFRATNKRMTEFFCKHYAQDYPEPEAIISAAVNGFKVQDRAVVMRERTAGVSSISPMKSVYFMMKVSIAVVMYRFSSVRKKKG